MLVIKQHLNFLCRQKWHKAATFKIMKKALSQLQVDVKEKSEHYEGITMNTEKEYK